MKLKQISVPIENSRNRLAELTRALGEKGINLRALNLVDTGDFGLLRILVSDVVASRQVLMQMGIPARVDDVVAVEIEDRPGRFSGLLDQLIDAGVRVKYTYAFAGMNSGKATLVFCFDDNDKAIVVLKEKSAAILDSRALGMRVAVA